jgi:hypothetical protein
VISQRQAPRKLIAAFLGLATLTLGLEVPGSSPAAARPSAKIPPQAQTAVEHIQENHRRFGLEAADVADLRVTDVYRSVHTGVTHVYLRQMVKSLEVARANATVNVMPDGTILSVGSRFMNDIAAKASGSVRLSSLDAVRRGARYLGLTSHTSPVLTSSRRSGEMQSRITWAGVSISPIPLQLAYYPTEDGRLRLAWQLEIEEVSQEHWWQIAIDAETGRLLSKVDYVNQHADLGHERPPATTARQKAREGARYRVFALPIESPNEGDRRLRRNPADKKASPFGWHDTDGERGHESTTTRGNNVHAYADYTPGANTALPTMDADGGDDLNFDFELDFADPPHLWRDAAVTNLFYWNNIIHDIAFRYGFNEPAGNFQATNYSGKAAGDDDVQAEAHDGQGVNNANFATPPDGQRPRMQMFLWPNTAHRQLIDGDLDAGVIIHEYTHGISNRLTGGPSEASCLRNQEQGGEGWSDWLALAFTARSKGEINKPRGIGTYVLGQEDRHQKGVRPTPYSTNKKINPTSYDSIKSAAVPHGVGYVWATMLWEMYAALVKEHGFNRDIYGNWRSGGNNLAVQLVMDGMKMQPCEPGFIDARDAIFDADKALTGGRNKCPLWRSFAKRGLGAKAKQGESTDRADGTEDFTIPKGC